MNTYSCIIVDDEPIALEILSTYIGRLEGFCVQGQYTNPVKAFEALQQEPIDLLFLDIQMPEFTGIELLKSLRTRPEVVLTTAYREFALEGFEFDVVDYLLKPISFDRFLKAIDKFYTRAGHKKNTQSPGPADLSPNAPHFFVRADRKNIKVLLDEILYLESLKDYVRIVTKNGNILTKETLTHFEQSLPNEAFMRVHRSFIVATNKITAWSGEGLEIEKQLVPVGRMYKMAVEKRVLG